MSALEGAAPSTSRRRTGWSSGIPSWSRACSCPQILCRSLWCQQTHYTLPCRCLLTCFQRRGAHYLIRQLVLFPGVGHPSWKAGRNPGVRADRKTGRERSSAGLLMLDAGLEMFPLRTSAGPPVPHRTPSPHVSSFLPDSAAGQGRRAVAVYRFPSVVIM